jgi:hypothetical protein
MRSKSRLIPYREATALEDAVFRQGAIPTRIFPILLPVWCVEVQAMITDAEDYELIDRYLERGIAEGRLCTVAELADFFALDESLVDRALRFLTAIGHVTENGGRYALTDLGYRSLRAGKCYVVTREARRKLYFDAFGSRPLTREYYDSRTVTLLTEEERKVAAERSDGPRFQALSGSPYGFRRTALQELAADADRERYNLPEDIKGVESLSEERVYLPTYIVRARERNGRIRHLVYTQAGDKSDDKADKYLSELCDRTPEIVAVLEAEERGLPPDLEMDRVNEWLDRRNFGASRPERRSNGMLRVTLSESAFTANGDGPSLVRLGSFVVVGTVFFQTWCVSEKVRRRALVERADTYLGVRGRIGRDELAAWLARVSRQLGLKSIDVPELRRMAAQAGRKGLVAQLDRLGRASRNAAI